jgi:hypothetical protein
MLITARLAALGLVRWRSLRFAESIVRGLGLILARMSGDVLVQAC